MLRAYGFAPVEQSEPQRLTQQVRPEALRVLSATEFKRIEAQMQADLLPKECMVSGPFDDAQAAALRRTLDTALPPGSWQLNSVVVPAHWIVYMGKFASADGLTKKRAELTAMNLVPQSVKNPDLEIGLSLGGFAAQADANAELARLSLRGIRTARVVLETQEGRHFELKLPELTQDLKSKLNDLKPALAGKPLRSCG